MPKCNVITREHLCLQAGHHPQLGIFRGSWPISEVRLLPQLFVFFALLGQGVIQARAQAPDEGAVPAAELLVSAEQLMTERKFDEALDALREAIGQKDEDPSSAAMAQYRLGEYLGYIKEYSKDKQHWLSVVESELRKVAVDFPEQTEAVNLSRVKLVDALLGQGKLAEAKDFAQTLLDTTQDFPYYQAWARLKLVEVSLTFGPGTEGYEINAAQMAAISELDQLITFAGIWNPEVANWARIRLQATLIATFQFDFVSGICGDVLFDHSAGLASDKQAAWALVLEATAYERQDRYEEAIESLELAIGVANPNHLDLVYRSEDDLRRIRRKMVDEFYKAGESALFGEPQDITSAQTNFELAQEYALEADGYLLEQSRMHLARIAHRVGEVDRAIAWWRLAVPDPNKMAGGGIEAADVIAWLFRGEKNQPAQEEAWRLYLLDPEKHEDPTAPIVAAELSDYVIPAASSDPPAGRISERLSALGRLYNREGRFDEAETTFEQALEAAVTNRQRGEALFGLVTSVAMTAKQLGKGSQSDEAQALYAEARGYAAQATELWLQVTLHNHRTDAHYATEQALYGWARVKDYTQALATAERFLAELGPDAEVSKIAFAEYMRVRALAWNKRYVEAAQAGMALKQQFAPHDNDGRVRTICAASLIRAAGYYSHAGDPQTGLDVLDTVDRLYPHQHTDWVVTWRERITRSLEQE